MFDSHLAQLLIILEIAKQLGTNAMIDDTQRINKVGEEWFGFLCINCGLPLLLGEIRPETLDSNGGVEIVSHNKIHKVTCPHCENKSDYQHTQLRRFRTVEKESLS
jgi:predicted RNA-binding Zn-ribbon protein involved in translation (DUF1610 family)